MLRKLTLAEMTALSGAMLDKSQFLSTFTSIPEVAWLIPQLKAAHEGVLASATAQDGPSPEMRAVNAKGLVIDNRHDHVARHISLALDAERERCLAAEPPDTERAAKCAHVGLLLFPEGLGFLNTSYLAEAGNTARVARVMKDDPEIGAFLKTVPVGGSGKKTLLDSVSRWIDLGKQLAGVDHERESLAARDSVKEPAEHGQSARSRWVRVANAILTNLEMSAAPAHAVEAIRGPLLRASDRAGKRRGNATNDTSALDPGTAPAPADNASPSPS